MHILTKLRSEISKRPCTDVWHFNVHSILYERDSCFNTEEQRFHKQTFVEQCILYAFLAVFSCWQCIYFTKWWRTEEALHGRNQRIKHTSSGSRGWDKQQLGPLLLSNTLPSQSIYVMYNGRDAICETTENEQPLNRQKLLTNLLSQHCSTINNQLSETGIH